MTHPIRLRRFSANLFRILAVVIWAIGLTGCQQNPQFLWSAKVSVPSDAASGQDGFEIPVEAKINGQPELLVFDTGYSMVPDIALWRSAAERFGLKPLPAQPPFHTTSPVKVNIGSSEATMPLLVADLPGGVAPGFDGLLGWHSIENEVFVFEADNLSAQVVEKLPENAVQWLKLALHQHPGWAITFAVNQKPTEPNLVMIDTGDDSGGVGLSAALWHEWRAQHPDAPATLTADTTIAGFEVREVAWAKKLTLGSLVLTDVPVYEDARINNNFMASMGMYAVTRTSLAIDVKNNAIYFNPAHTIPLPYPANRAGVVFIPQDNGHDDLVAHVLEGTPAYKAGIRNDDLLLKIGDQDVTHWRTNPTILSNSKVWEQPPGTKVELTLKRGDATFTATVTLRNILGAE